MARRPTDDDFGRQNPGVRRNVAQASPGTPLDLFAGTFQTLRLLTDNQSWAGRRRGKLSTHLETPTRGKNDTAKGGKWPTTQTTACPAQ